MTVPLAQHPRHWAEVAPDRPAIIMGGTGEVVTYAELSDRADRCAHLRRRLGSASATTWSS